MRERARLQRRSTLLASLLLAALLLTWPALLNRYPLLYPDSIGYLHDGPGLAAALFLHRLEGFTAQRSELYSLGILPFHATRTAAPIIALNALLTAWILFLTVRSLLSRHTLPWFLAITALLSVFTSLSWYVSLLMPDILGALLYLAFYLLVFARATLSPLERRALALVALWSITAHATHLMLASGLCLLFAMLFALPARRLPGTSPARRSFSARGLAEAAALVAIAATLQIALHAFLYGRPSLDGNRPPYLMARLVADGPARIYLRTHCPTLPWAICDDLQRLPDNDDIFLWDAGGIWSSASPQKQQRLLAEEMPLVRATLRAYPRQQLAISFANFLHQANDFGVNDFDSNTWMDGAILGTIPHSHYPASLQARSALPTNRFTLVQRWAMLGCAGLLFFLLPYLRRSPRLAALTLVVAPVLLANALLTAVLSSSDSRYQARVIWLLPLLAALGTAHRLAQPRTAPDEAAGLPGKAWAAASEVDAAAVRAAAPVPPTAVA